MAKYPSSGDESQCLSFLIESIRGYSSDRSASVMERTERFILAPGNAPTPRKQLKALCSCRLAQAISRLQNFETRLNGST
jgi:hypothetical protein